MAARFIQTTEHLDIFTIIEPPLRMTGTELIHEHHESSSFQQLSSARDEARFCYATDGRLDGPDRQRDAADTALGTWGPGSPIDNESILHSRTISDFSGAECPIVITPTGAAACINNLRAP